MTQSSSWEVGGKTNCKVIFKAFKTRNFLKITVIRTPSSIINPQTCPSARSHLDKHLFSHRVTVQHFWTTLFHCCSPWSTARGWPSGLWSKSAGLHGRYRTVTNKVSTPVQKSLWQVTLIAYLRENVQLPCQIFDFKPGLCLYCPFQQISLCMHACVHTHTLFKILYSQVWEEIIGSLSMLVEAKELSRSKKQVEQFCCCGRENSFSERYVFWKALLILVLLVSF